MFEGDGGAKDLLTSLLFPSAGFPLLPAADSGGGGPEPPGPHGPGLDGPD